MHVKLMSLCNSTGADKNIYNYFWNFQSYKHSVTEFLYHPEVYIRNAGRANNSFQVLWVWSQLYVNRINTEKNPNTNFML
jgi:hypothetical protein